MNICGIIAEYNPFHNGHAYQIQYTKDTLKADYVIIAMSGDFVQRGTPALLPKHLRAEMALRGGADLVLELPTAAANASAEFFAQNGVALLDSLGVVNTLCFGSETGCVDALMELASLLVEEPEDYRNALKEGLGSGLSFPAARSQAVLEYFRDARHFTGDDFDGVLMPLLNQIGDILASPNNILGIEYCKALLRRKSSIRPIALKREGAGYHEKELQGCRYPSASGIRRTLRQASELGTWEEGNPEKDSWSESSLHEHSLDERSLKERSLNEHSLNEHSLHEHSLNKSSIKKNSNIQSDSKILGTAAEPLFQISSGMPESAFLLLEQACRQNAFLTEGDLDLLLHYRLLQETTEQLGTYLDVSPALAQRISNRLNEYQGFSRFAALLKTKEVTQTRIQRALLHILLHIRNVPSEVPYARVLGFRRDSAALLSQIKANSSIPLVTKLADAPASLDESGKRILEENTFASNVYESLLAHKTGKKFIHEYQKPVVIV